MSNSTPAVPAGYREDHQGRLVPEAQIADAVRLRDELVRHLGERCAQASADLAGLKTDLLTEIADHVALVATQYGAQITGQTGDVRLESFDGRWRVERTSARRLVVGEQIHAAEQLVREYLDAETQGASASLRAIVDRTFRRNAKTGELNVSRLVDFASVQIDDERWMRAQAAIRDAIQAADSVTYFRAYQRPSASEPWVQIPLDFSTVRATS